MAQLCGPIVTGIAGGAIAQFQLVKMSTGKKFVACNNTNDIPVGVATVKADADGDAISLQAIANSYQIKVKTGGTAIGDGVAVGTNGSGLLAAKTSGHRIGFVLGEAEIGEVAEVIVAVH